MFGAVVTLNGERKKNKQTNETAKLQNCIVQEINSLQRRRKKKRIQKYFVYSSFHIAKIPMAMDEILRVQLHLSWNCCCHSVYYIRCYYY